MVTAMAASAVSACMQGLASWKIGADPVHEYGSTKLDAAHSEDGSRLSFGHALGDSSRLRSGRAFRQSSFVHPVSPKSKSSSATLQARTKVSSIGACGAADDRTCGTSWQRRHSRLAEMIYTRSAMHRHGIDCRKSSQRASVATCRAARGSDCVKVVLDESEMPTRWYNIVADLPSPPPPPLSPATRQPITPDDLAPIFPMALIEQEVSTERYIDIPQEILDIYKLWRPSPLYRARRLEKLLDTPARIYYKYEGVSPAGSHKPNTAVPQAWYNKQEGVKKLTTETGAGQWGSALAFATSLFDLECEVWQVRASYDAKPHRRTMMNVWGGTVHPSPSDVTASGRAILAKTPDSPGSLGIAISEAVEIAAADPDAKYALGSVLNHVLLHQTIIGEEAIKQMKKINEVPDVIVACVGGGSNFGGLVFPFLREKLAGKISPRVVAVEPAACPSLTKGVYAYDFGDTAGLTPLLKMKTLGHTFIPDPIHAGGLRYHGVSPLISHMHELGMFEAMNVGQTECFDAALKFARTEGIVPAPEPTHALAITIREALECRRTGEEKVILTALCGHGHFDLAAYEKYLAGDIRDLKYEDNDKIADALKDLPLAT